MAHPEWLLMTAGCLHFLQIPSTAHLARRLLGLRPDLAKLSPINGRIVRVFVAAASILILGLGVIVVSHTRELLSTDIGRHLCVLLVLFWSGRAAAQIWLRRVWPREAHGNFWYFALLTVYLTIALSYLGAACS